MVRWSSKPKQIVKVQTVGRSLEKRLAKIEQELAQVTEGEPLKSCICGNGLLILSAGAAGEFRTEMNRLCPVHGFRELDFIHLVVDHFGHEPPSPAEVTEESEVEEVLNEYYRRLAESRRRTEEDD